MANIDPAWSWGDEASGTTPSVEAAPFLESATPEDIFRGATGRGVKVAIVDSGVDNAHPVVAAAVRGWAEPEISEEGEVTINTAPHEDVFGHGTACAGIVHKLRPRPSFTACECSAPDSGDGRGLSPRGSGGRSRTAWTWSTLAWARPSRTISTRSMNSSTRRITAAPSW